MNKLWCRTGGEAEICDSCVFERFTCIFQLLLSGPDTVKRCLNKEMERSLMADSESFRSSGWRCRRRPTQNGWTVSFQRMGYEQILPTPSWTSMLHNKTPTQLF